MWACQWLSSDDISNHKKRRKNLITNLRHRQALVLTRPTVLLGEGRPDTRERRKSSLSISLFWKNERLTLTSLLWKPIQYCHPIQDTYASNSPSSFVLLTFLAHHWRGSLDLSASNELLSLVILELFSMASASATTFSLKAKLYEEQRAFGMIDYYNFEREGLFETGF